MNYKNIEIATSSRLDTLNVFTEITKVVFILYIYSNFVRNYLVLSLDIQLFCFYKIVAQLVRRIRLSATKFDFQTIIWRRGYLR